MPTGTDILMRGSADLDLYTRTINGGSYNGKICVWLFTRQLVTVAGNTTAVDTAVINKDVLNPDTHQYGLTYWTVSQSPWNTSWAPIHLRMDFDSFHLTSGLRFGLAVAVEKSGTGDASGLQFMYDAPSYDSRLQVDINQTPPF